MPLVGSSRFELISKLGEGGMGIVYEAQDRERNMRVALKTLRRLDAASLYQFKREFRALGDLSHPNIVALYELVSEGDDWYLSMELVPGTDFITYVHKGPVPDFRPEHPSGNTGDETPPTRDVEAVEAVAASSPTASPTPFLLHQVPVDTVVDLERLRNTLSQLAQALHALHAHGMVHRDLKPSNVRVTPEGRVVLMDFGIVAQTREPANSARARAVGTPAYMAPEQAAGKPPTAAADWYGFGVLLYLALTGRLPYDGATDQVMLAKQQHDPVPPGAYVRGIPAELERLCMRLLSRHPPARPSGSEILANLGVDMESIPDLGHGDDAQVFVGRTEYLNTLQAAYDDVAAGQTICVVVEGQSGMGKSTLLHRFTRELRIAKQKLDAPRPMLLAGRCNERESVPYKAFDSVIDSLSHELMELPDVLVDRLLPADVDLLTRLFPVLRRIPGVQVARPLSGANLPELRARAVEALRMLLDNLGDHQPVVIRIDDLQWADRNSLDLLVDLLEPPAPRRLMVLVSIRTDTRAFEELAPGSQLLQVMGTLQRQSQCMRLPLGPLSPGEQALLVQALLKKQHLSIDVEDLSWADLQAESGGNPLFLIELARFVLDNPETLRARQRVRLEDVITQRFDQLPPHARALLEAMVVAGEPLPLQILAAAAGLSSTDRERASSVLRIRNWTRSARTDRGAWLNVQHKKLRQTLLGHIPAPRRRELHLRFAQALEHWEDAPVPSLTRHWMGAGNPAQAALYLMAAARFAAQKGAFDRSASLYRVVLELQGEAPAPQRLLLLRALGEMLASAGRMSEAATVYTDAAAAAREAGDESVIELLRLGADCLLRSGRIEQGMRILAEVMNRLGTPLETVPPRNATILARLLIERMQLAMMRKPAAASRGAASTAEGAQHLDALHTAALTLFMTDSVRGTMLQVQHLSTVLRHGDEHRICRALAVEAAYLGFFGRKHARRAQAMSQDVMLRARRLDDAYLIGLGHLCTGSTAFFSSRMRAAVEHFARSLTVLEQIVGAEWERITALYLRCMALQQLGAWSELLSPVQRAIETAERRNDIYAGSLFKSQLGTWCFLIADRVADAHEGLDTALAEWPADRFYLPHHQVAIARALIYLYEGDGAAAAELLDAVLPRMRELHIAQVPLLASDMLLCRGRAALLLGDVATARQMIRRLARLDTPQTRAQATLLEVPLRLHLGDTQRAERLLSGALESFNEQGARHLEAACQYRLGQLLGGRVGEDLVATALRWTEAQGLANPERMLRLLTWSEPGVGGAATSRRRPSHPPLPVKSGRLRWRLREHPGQRGAPALLHRLLRSVPPPDSDH